MAKTASILQSPHSASLTSIVTAQKRAQPISIRHVCCPSRDLDGPDGRRKGVSGKQGALHCKSVLYCRLRRLKSGNEKRGSGGRGSVRAGFSKDIQIERSLAHTPGSIRPRIHPRRFGREALSSAPSAHGWNCWYFAESERVPWIRTSLIELRKIVVPAHSPRVMGPAKSARSIS